MIDFLPKEEQPREKAIRSGLHTLSENELLALLLRTGSKQETVLSLANKVITEIKGFQNLPTITYYDLVKIKGIKESKAITVLAAVEIAKRLQKSTHDKYTMKTPKDIYHFLRNRFLFEGQEKVMVLCLNNKLELIKEKIVYVGSSDMSFISGKEILKEALISGSTRIVVVHNHPSGDPNPSTEDIAVTEKIRNMSKELDIEMIDHIIIGENCFYSFTANAVITCKVD